MSTTETAPETLGSADQPYMRPPGPGHNNPPAPPAAAASIAADRLRSIVERVERLEEEKQALADDVKEVYAEAKATGFDTTTLRAIVRLRKMDKATRAEREALQDLYLSALGMVV